MHPLIADGGEMTVLRDLAAYSYGQWSVDWPESVPDDQRPELPDDRDFGYASKPDRQPGVFARRFVRADVDITAQDFDDAGAPIPFTGESNVEETLDDTSRRTEGDVFFEREITRAGLGALVPRVDFDVDSIVPVLIWGKTIMSPVTSIEDVVEAGAVVDYRVYVGGQLLQDDAARERANREVERTIAQERRERVESVAKERKARQSAISAESRRSDAYADAAAARVEKSLAQASKELSDEIANTVRGADFAEYSAELQEKLWGDQGEFNKITSEFQAKQEQINAQNEEFRRLTEQLDAQQNEQIEQITAVQQQMAEESQGQIRELMATRADSSDPQIRPTPRADGKPGWQVTLTDMVRGALFHIQWYDVKGTTNTGGEIVEPTAQVVNTLSTNSKSYTLQCDSNEYIYVRWVRQAKKQVSVDKSDGGWDVPRSSWEYIMSYPAPTKIARQVALRLKVTWAAATYDDTYGIRIRAGDRVLQERMMGHLGPMAFWEDGQRWMSVTVSDGTIEPGETVKVDVFSTATFSSGRRVKEAQLTGTWIEEA